MRFIRVFLKKPIFTSMVFTALTVLGIVSLLRLPYDLLPDVTIPEITVVTNFPGASPEVVEREITRRVEEGVYGVKGVMDVRSVSTEGQSLITVYFHRESDMKSALLHLRERMDEVFWSFPEGSERPNLLTRGPSSKPIMGIWVKGDRELVKGVVSRRLEQIEGVGEARLLGMEAREIRINVDPLVLDGFGINPEEIVRTLRSYNITTPSGEVREGSYTFPLRFISKTQNIEEVGMIPLKEGVYRLKDIAHIEEGEEERTSSVFFNGKKGYFIQIFREWKTNSVRVSRKVRGLIGKLEKDYPELNLVVTFDDAEFITESIKEILFALFLGGILAFIALFLFTGNRRIPFILSLSMPLSIIPAFFLFYIGGISINTMSLAGMALGIGMLVDSSIVVLENIIKRGDPVKGATEVGIAVTTGILTTIAVFFPVIYVHGLAGTMLKPLSFSVIATLLLSLFVAFSLLPLLSRGIKGVGDTRFNRKLKEGYKGFLDWIYGNKRSVYLYSTLFLLTGLFTFFILKKEALPPTTAELIIEYELPFNSSIAETEKIGKRLSDYFISTNASVLLSVGEIDPFEGSHTGRGELRIKRYRGNPKLDRLFSDYRNISYSKKEYNPVLSVFSSLGRVYLRAYYNTDNEGEKILTVMNERLKDAIFSFTERIPVVNVIPRERVLAEAGVTTEEILSRIRMFTGGQKVLDVERGEERISIVLKHKGDIEDLKNLKVKGVPLSFLTDVRMEDTKRAIVRFNGKRCIEANLPYRGRLKLPHFPFKIEIGGEVEEYIKAQRSAFFAFGIAIFLVFLILASFYESFLLPFLIMVAVPFATAGFLVSLLLTGTSLNTISLIGLVVLVGIVVNDSIVLIDRAEGLRREGIIFPGRKAAEARLRPIVMTTITTVVGVIPFSIGNTLHSPIGRGLIGGLILSTFITLVLIPMIYDRIFS